MYILLKNGELKRIMREAIEKAGSYKGLAERVKIPKSKVWSYQNYNITLTEERLNKILGYVNKKIGDVNIEEELPDNWRQIIGGNNCVKKKIKDGTLNNQLAQSRENIKKTLSDWHKEQKNKDQRKYYLSQYDKFKKIAEYKLVTKNGEKVRNRLEKDVADLLQSLNLNYKYESLIKVGNKYFFPDFLIKRNTILECTMWRGQDKAIKLKSKIKDLEKEYEVYVIIPKKLEKYYQTIRKNIVFSEDLNKFLKTL